MTVIAAAGVAASFSLPASASAMHGTTVSKYRIMQRGVASTRALSSPSAYTARSPTTRRRWKNGFSSPRRTAASRSRTAAGAWTWTVSPRRVPRATPVSNGSARARGTASCMSWTGPWAPPSALTASGLSRRARVATKIKSGCSSWCP